ncbi:MAG: alpha-L-fucosidase [Chloroflexi bacterium]|nr:alpha-L-fucosidase [Chloroflexota bacterium]
MIARFGDGRDWFFEKRFGLFIHWGLYAIPAWHEQLQWRGSVPRREYEQLIHQFNPVHFDPDAWLDLAEEAGMRYLCITTKHHDGFCLWDTAQTDYNVMNTPYGKDIIAMVADACRRRGFPLCFYYSVVDWHHPNYPNQGRSHELPRPEPGDEPNWPKYRAFLIEQVRELCTRYGEIGGFWWDMNVTGVIDRSINELIRSLQPNAVINNRGFDEGDFGTPERDYDTSLEEQPAFSWPTEACQSVGRESWGYKEDEDYYALRHLIASIDRTLAKGGNYLLNVGPKADGTFPDEAIRLLRAIGRWYGVAQEALLDVEPATHLIEERGVLLTRRGNTLYVHLTNYPTTRRVLLKPIAVAPRSATLLNNGQPVKVSLADLPTLHMGPGGSLIAPKQEYLRLRELPVDAFGDSVLVVKLEFEDLDAALGRARG